MTGQSFGDKVFDIMNYTILFLLAAVCILPFIHVIAVSLSDTGLAATGEIFLWPKGTNLKAYEYAFSKPNFVGAIWNSTYRLVLGLSINMLLTIFTAYPLSKSDRQFPGRTAFAWFFIITMLVSGGLVPLFLIVTQTGIRNTVWALIFPYAVPVFNLTILINFFRGIPIELEESAHIDGANFWKIMWRIYVPLSMPCLATLIVIQSVFHWNEWLWGQIFIDDFKRYPLATYVRSLIVETKFDNATTTEEIEALLQVSNKTFRAAQVIIATLPILCVYPFMQRYFVKGMTLGGVKG